jgi:DNA-binding NarL/FixJ family response regulator
VARIDTLVVARDPVFRADFAQIVGKHFVVVGAARLDQALEEIERGLRPRLLIIEAAAADFGVLKRIRSEVPAVKTVVLMDANQAMPFAAPAQCDIDGCVPTDMLPETLKLSLGLIMAGQVVTPRRLASTIYRGRTAAVLRNAGHFLTPRECEVLRLLTLGRSSKEIARKLATGATGRSTRARSTSSTCSRTSAPGRCDTSMTSAMAGSTRSRSSASCLPYPTSLIRA